MKLQVKITMAAAILMLGAGTAEAQLASEADAGSRASWRIDASHSELSFQIRHMVSRVRGGFGEWSGTIDVDPANLSGGSVAVDIDAATIDTGNERRDADLRGAEFFDSGNHPLITFRSRSVERVGEGGIRVTGDLTIRGVSHEVVLEGDYLGSMRDSRGRDRIGFEAETTIDRHDYGITWNRLVEGGNLLGDEVKIIIAVQAVRE